MYKSMWDILEIDETDDEKKIKQAYANKLKLIGRSDVTAFQEIKDAFDSARRYIKNKEFYEQEYIKNENAYENQSEISNNYLREDFTKNLENEFLEFQKKQQLKLQEFKEFQENELSDFLKKQENELNFLDYYYVKNNNTSDETSLNNKPFEYLKRLLLTKDQNIINNFKSDLQTIPFESFEVINHSIIHFLHSNINIIWCEILRQYLDYISHFKNDYFLKNNHKLIEIENNLQYLSFDHNDNYMFTDYLNFRSLIIKNINEQDFDAALEMISKNMTQYKLWENELSSFEMIINLLHPKNNRLTKQNAILFYSKILEGLHINPDNVLLQICCFYILETQKSIFILTKKERSHEGKTFIFKDDYKTIFINISLKNIKSITFLKNTNILDYSLKYLVKYYRP